MSILSHHHKEDRTNCCKMAQLDRNVLEDYCHYLVPVLIQNILLAVCGAHFVNTVFGDDSIMHTLYIHHYKWNTTHSVLIKYI